MPDRAKLPNSPPSEVALLRYLIVSQVLHRERQGEQRATAVEATASLVHRTLDGDELRRSARTLYRWVAAFEQQGIVGLEPVVRARTSTSLVLSEDFLELLRDQKQLDVRVSVPEVIRRARELGVVGPSDSIDRTTVWRACRRMGLPTRRRKAARERDTRRFEYPHRMDMVLCDGKHFRAGAQRLRRVVLFFLDDSSRFGLHAVVDTSENRRIFLRGLYEMVRRHGLFDLLYLDQGPGFIAGDTIEVVRKLNALLIHGEKGYPEGRGKIERFNRTALAQVLRGLDRRPDVDPDCGALELRLQHYLRQVYNHRPHESLQERTPHERFFGDPRALRFPPDDTDLRRRFVVHFERDVSNDHIVSVGSVLYEVPRGHAGTRVRLYRQILDEQLSILHRGRMVPLHPADLAANARAQRAGSAAVDEEPAHPLPKSAADLAFERDFRPVVGPDGGCIPTYAKEE